MRWRSRCPLRRAATQAEAIADIRAQLDRLLPHGFVTATGATHLGDLTRYLTAVGRRLERLPQGVNADRERMARVHAVQDAYDELRQALSPCARGRRRRARHRAHDRGAAGEPVGPAARHRAAGQRAAHLPGDRRHHTLSRVLSETQCRRIESADAVVSEAAPVAAHGLGEPMVDRVATEHRRVGPRRTASNSSGSSMQWQAPIARGRPVHPKCRGATAIPAPRLGESSRGHAEHSPCQCRRGGPLDGAHQAGQGVSAARCADPWRRTARRRCGCSRRATRCAAPRRPSRSSASDTAGRGSNPMIGPNGRRPISPNRAAAAAAAVWASSSSLWWLRSPPTASRPSSRRDHRGPRAARSA